MPPIRPVNNAPSTPNLTLFNNSLVGSSSVDLVISVDTAVAHLAGALNRPTWLLLPQNADFRWLKDRSDSPWYPSMRLFRQHHHGDWSGVIKDLRHAFEELTLLDFQSLADNNY